MSGDCSKYGISNLAQTSPIKCYWMLQNTRVTTFTVAELLRENHQEGEGGRGGKITPTQIRVKLRKLQWFWSI